MDPNVRGRSMKKEIRGRGISGAHGLQLERMKRDQEEEYVRIIRDGRHRVKQRRRKREERGHVAIRIRGLEMDGRGVDILRSKNGPR